MNDVEKRLIQFAALLHTSAKTIAACAQGGIDDDTLSDVGAQAILAPPMVGIIGATALIENAMKPAEPGKDPPE